MSKANKDNKSNDIIYNSSFGSVNLLFLLVDCVILFIISQKGGSMNANISKTEFF